MTMTRGGRCGCRAAVARSGTLTGTPPCRAPSSPSAPSLPALTAGAGTIPPAERASLDCRAPATPDVVAICKDPVLKGLYGINERSEVDAGRRHPRETLDAARRARDARLVCGYDRECLRGALSRHSEDLTQLLSR